MNFKPGDRVEWTSQSQGSTTAKTGTVVMVIPAGYHPRTRILLGDYTLTRHQMQDAVPRNHVSYLIQTGQRRRLYWPLVKNLRLSDAMVFPEPPPAGVPVVKHSVTSMLFEQLSLETRIAQLERQVQCQTQCLHDLYRDHSINRPRIDAMHRELMMTRDDFIMTRDALRPRLAACVPCSGKTLNVFTC